MKKALFYLIIVSLSFLACSKSDDNGPASSSDVSTSVFYTDTFNIYSTDLKGGSRKLVTAELPNTGNNYIYATAYIPIANRLVYIYTEAYDKPFFLKTCKLDGSDKRTIKTFPAFTNVGLVKATSDGQIIYTLPGKPFPNQTASKVFSIKADGSGETEITVPFYATTNDPDLISADGKGILSTNGYFALLVNGVFDERNSFNVLMNEDKDQTKFRELSLSNDGTKLTFAQTSATAGKYEIRIKNVAKDAAASTVLYNLTIPAEASESSLSLRFVNGTKNILVSYGKFTSPKGSVNDYTHCDLIDVASGKVNQTWKFMGDEVYDPVTN